MKIVNKLLKATIDKCGSTNSVLYLRILSFTESIFFPIPTDALLAPMVLSRKHNWVRITLIASYWSVIGGVVGYLLGFYIFDMIEPILHDFGLYSKYVTAKSYFISYGLIFLFIAAFTPIPYKVFTISAGVLSFNLLLFILISLIGRSARFFLVSYICLRYGERILALINKYLLIIAIFIFFVIGLLLWV